MVALKVLSILVLVMVHVLDAALIPCVWTQFRLKILNEESIDLLNSMYTSMTLAVIQDEDLAMVSLEVLRGVERIFKNEPTTVTWDKEKLGLFRNVISYRQVENLQKCVSVSNCENTFGIVWKYGFSECSWEMARDKVTNVLMKFQAFLESRK
ncbi:hypothetical protein AMEX_G4549 [Astyanax mexicanus]|uniref:Uncharacterized protein n=1 Tax=Astyanax mexicanus TaxID=7994 RepID=A0A8T2M7G0_ASTMX|nr:hypothetical protein AMEX_G4547 [Astyanax mexicanus]KAG9279079.1 hypothetical protein AMEX_G4549 [Astyanax mexicanus]